MKEIRTVDAAGQVLCHDITRIVRGVTKDAVFRKGHVITEEDIPVLLSVGKDHIFVWENDPSELHENEAARILQSLCQNDYMEASEPKEGKSNCGPRWTACFRWMRSGLTRSMGSTR